MKEKTDENEAMVKWHEEQKEAGKTVDEIRRAAIEQFVFTGSDPTHSYRAWLARVCNPNKYSGRFTERMKPFQKKGKTITEASQPVAAEAVVTVELMVEKAVETFS